MNGTDRLPAVPLITHDPYFSVWCAADKLTDADTTHWCGKEKRIRGSLCVDGTRYRFLGLGDGPAMRTTSLRVTPTATESVCEADGVRFSVRFTSPLLLDDPELLSTPVTFLEFTAESADGRAHQIRCDLTVSDEFCYDEGPKPPMFRDQYQAGGLCVGYTGQRRQRLLCHSGDRITIDWGYLYLAGEDTVRAGDDGLESSFEATVSREKPDGRAYLIGYDDVVSVNYFGMPCKAWYARNGKTLPEALYAFHAQKQSILDRCRRFDAGLTAEARAVGGEDYALICAAAYRQSVAAHKLIADERQNMVFLSKENDSNGCIGTTDVSYPSVPLFLKYNPSLVTAMCRPILRFAKLPAWPFDYAPHDVGRYPYATGQVYHTPHRGFGGEKPSRSDILPGYCLYPAGVVRYEEKDQMPVEECGNMLIMLYAASVFGSGDTLSDSDLAMLDKWAQYLRQFGENPGDQLCTDDFGGHLARNVNLAAKAIVSLACYAGILLRGGYGARAGQALSEAKKMAKSWESRASAGGHTALTFDGYGWSLKYNLIWDRVLKLRLFDPDVFRKETDCYLLHMNRYGVPLDCRNRYTKSDWLLWAASFARQKDTFRKIIAPVADYLRETKTRVPFSDWYDTDSGDYIHFIARSVQGGVFMPLLCEFAE